MAATWEVKMQARDLPSKNVIVTATRTDGEDVRTYSAEGTFDSESQPAKDALVMYTGIFRDLYERDLAHDDPVLNVLAQGEVDLATALNNQESVIVAAAGTLRRLWSRVTGREVA